MKRFTLMLVAALAACSPTPDDDTPRPEAKPLTVYADSALTEAFTQIGKDFEASQGIKAGFVFGASSALEKLAADADVFASASVDNMKYDSKVFALNRLVLAIPQGNPKNVRVYDSFVPGAAQTSYAMCVEEAPCGAAAKNVLKNAPLRGGVPGPKAVGQDVKETLAKLTSGEVDSAFVYASDVKANPGLFSVPTRLGNEPSQKADLKFPIAIVSGSPEAKKFYDFVLSEKARAVLTDAGFELP
ncbi:molybdate transport system substrate-binding protein [Lentzea atacamensis]|uniref:Molybdate transport system substrate-binding protein n=1 Tax=Lentzea atacamensis TaxID=531938 RepID=A0A316HLY1_9PSEU|nr:molybdate ABC transporter substrate-binding protein [Lentzea atacamensis]PWK81006.1 molybdate transport system substrate-binding protein [Lentzea atacamensis]RAS62255.1 molybdate transport system substrate-binding protein [Lentzea atacamensis]